MQKTFLKYFLLIMVVTVGLTLVANFFLQTMFAQRNAQEHAQRSISEVSRRIAENETVIADLRTSLNENYLARTRALAEIIAQNPQLIEDSAQLVRITKLLDVDEVHVTDEAGILRWGTVPGYYGLDFTATDQTRPFLPALTDKSFELAQEPQPNGSIGRLFQYISVARQDRPGIVQVGVAPEILDQALANNKIDVVIENFNVQDGVNVIALDAQTGVVVGDTRHALIGTSSESLGIAEAALHLKRISSWVTRDGEKLFAVYGQVGDYIVELTYTNAYLYADRQSQNMVAAISSILLGLAIIIAIFFLLKHVIIRDIEQVNLDLETITHGGLDVVVRAKSTPELAVLSGGLNQMVSSLHAQLTQIAHQASLLEERNQTILASLNYARKLQSNLLPSPQAFESTFSDYAILWEPKELVGGDIYWMREFSPGSVLCVCDCTGHGTPGALLTMLVASALDAIVDESTCTDPAGLLWALDQRLIRTLSFSEGDHLFADGGKDGADLAILSLARDGSIALASAKFHIFVCNGHTVEDIHGQRLSLGDGSLGSRSRITTVTLDPAPGSAYYIVSDGLFEQVGGDSGLPFGFARFKQLVLECHCLPQKEICQRIWHDFQAYMGGETRRDDVTLVSFKL